MLQASKAVNVRISIHAPREGGDTKLTNAATGDDVFQSTPPARGATGAMPIVISATSGFQSTPPARGATSAFPVIVHPQTEHFNPRPPRGGRPQRWHTPCAQP